MDDTVTVSSKGATAEEGAAEEGASPSDAEIAIPPFALVGMFIIGILTYSCLHTNWWKLRFSNLFRNNKIDAEEEKLLILTAKDKELLREIKSFQNNPLAMVKLALPAAISMAFCPITLVMFKPTVQFLWPPDKFETLPDINQAIICFLMPAGMIYAIASGFFFEDVITEFMQLSYAMTKTTATLRQIAMLTSTVKGFTSQQKQEVFLALKDQVMMWMSYMTQRKKQDEVTLQNGSTLNILNTIQNSTSDSIHGILDNQIVTEIVQKLLKVDMFITSRSIAVRRKLNLLQWFFLEVLGFISFFGVLMIRAQSYRIELTMCIMTVFSISIFCYMLSDFNSVLHGVFRIDLAPIYNTLLSDINDLHEKHCDATNIKTTLNIGKLMKPLSKNLCESFSLNNKKITSLRYH